MRDLTPRQRRYVDEYLTSRDPVEAGRRAGYSARRRASHWRLRNVPHVRAALEAGWRERCAEPAPDFGNVFADPQARPLTARQARFVDEYLVDGNIKAAARRAGFATPGGAGSVYVMAKRPNVAAAIRARLSAQGITCDRVVIELAKIAFANPLKMFGEGWRMRGVSEVDPDTAAAFAVTVKRRADGTSVVWFRQQDKIRALCRLLEYVQARDG
jgi:phage terminase small subunit